MFISYFFRRHFIKKVGVMKKIVLWKLSLFLLVIGAALSMFSCASSRPATRADLPPAPAAPRYDESFDPYTLEDEDITFPESAAVVNPSERPGNAAAGQNAPVEENRQIDGFRVQLFATNFIEKATLEKKEAEYLFAEDSIAVYIEFDSPMYKVRIGDCKTRDEAERYRRLARKKGYPTAFIVKTKINTNPVLPKRQDLPEEPEIN